MPRRFTASDLFRLERLGKTAALRIVATVFAPPAGWTAVEGHQARADPLGMKWLTGYKPRPWASNER